MRKVAVFGNAGGGKSTLAKRLIGYSRLMELDERRTLVLLHERRHKMLYPLVAVHHDRIVKLLGWRSQRTPAPF